MLLLILYALLDKFLPLRGINLIYLKRKTGGGGLEQESANSVNSQIVKIFSFVHHMVSVATTHSAFVSRKQPLPWLIHVNV